MYLSLDPSLRTASTFIEVVPVLAISKPIMICLLDVADTTVVKLLFASVASACEKLFAMILSYIPPYI